MFCISVSVKQYSGHFFDFHIDLAFCAVRFSNQHSTLLLNLASMHESVIIYNI